jgi:hypothetical protein
MMPGIPERRTHSYVRHGTTSLFAALDTASGFVIGKCYKRHRAAEFLDFLKQIDVGVPEGLDVHIIMDMCGRPRRCKKNLFEERGAWSGADMCPASAAACHMPPARMGVRGAGPIQSRALKARIHDLVFPIPSR